VARNSQAAKKQTILSFRTKGGISLDLTPGKGASRHAPRFEMTRTTFSQSVQPAETLVLSDEARRLNNLRKTHNAVILSEAKNLSLFLLQYLNRREILRFAQNDRTNHFFRSL
jgi:hypothetical protein